MVQLTMRKKKEFTNINSYSSTTLMYATQYGHVDLVELLLDLGHEEEVISVVRKIKMIMYLF